jgi:hypothetical protein
VSLDVVVVVVDFDAFGVVVLFTLLVVVVVRLVLVPVVSVCAEAIPKASTAASVKNIFFIIVIFIRFYIIKVLAAWQGLYLTA